MSTILALLIYFIQIYSSGGISQAGMHAVLVGLHYQLPSAASFLSALCVLMNDTREIFSIGVFVEDDNFF